jgi:hypothetical protein
LQKPLKEKIEDTNWVIRSHKSKRDRKYSHQKKKTNNDPQKTTYSNREQNEPHLRSEVNSGSQEA